ncbi:DUF4913 domain-containing protein [Plantactinospora sp. KBS50]|uniref:DUF4913 domain-containing protein n=1 Tax=Plantactinospora sp. KBS50 TaxID=2024580 RepID=UPI000BAAC9FC|nr:DUF4913 domain-containing protein [Plantactinospora sp. KBS50]ASW53434.1 DUF4913 domain-containing protein [Plantactinospora sp. KBS50]
MTHAVEHAGPADRPTDEPAVPAAPHVPGPDTQDPQTPDPEAPPGTRFILYLDDDEQDDEVARLSTWVRHLLLPVYGRETGSTSPWCPQWWEHPEAVAQLYGLWMAWTELTGPGSPMTGPANWHRDYLGPVMGSLRDPAGPFAGCKPGMHRDKEAPAAEEYPG